MQVPNFLPFERTQVFDNENYKAQTRWLTPPTEDKKRLAYLFSGSFPQLTSLNFPQLIRLECQTTYFTVDFQIIFWRNQIWEGKGCV